MSRQTKPGSGGRSSRLPFLAQYKGVHKLLVAVAIGVIAFFALSLTKLGNQIVIILAWDCFCTAMIIFSWIVFVQTDEKQLCEVCDRQDEGVKAIFVMVIGAVLASLFGVMLLLAGGGAKDQLPKVVQMVISLSPVLLSWFLLHTIFTIRYAHLYNDDNKLNTGSKKGGLCFPDKDSPDYVDFAYFSFVVGMTFQVSDVTITSRTIRRFVLLHSLISFAFNTVIVALTINSIAGLKG